MADQLEAIVQRMIDAGEPEDNIASVIREYKTTAPAPMQAGATALSTDGGLATPYVTGALGIAKLTPAIMAGVNTGAKMVGNAATSHLGRMATGMTVLDAAGRMVRGDYQGAAKAGATAIGLSQVPRIATAIQNATSPAIVALRGAGGRFATGGRAAGPLMRGAGAVSDVAGAVAGPALAMSLAHDVQQRLIQAVNDPQTPDDERQALMRVLMRSGGGSPSR